LVVVIDIFRASSAICTAIAHGVEAIIPVTELSEALDYKNKGFITAAERNGEVVPGFDFGNSPFAFMDEKLSGKCIVLTTSNCTRAIHEAKGASEILIGAFVNISALCRYLLSRQEDVLLLCAGWKNRYNLEDSIFAGAVTARLKDQFIIDCDSAFASMQLFLHAEKDIYHFLRHSSHTQRLSHLHIDRDIEYCLKHDQANVVPVFNGESVVAADKVLA
jgi:2-phosphosulfolactate phosphatase